jgi:hypothetical protein
MSSKTRSEWPFGGVSARLHTLFKNGAGLPYLAHTLKLQGVWLEAAPVSTYGLRARGNTYGRCLFHYYVSGCSVCTINPPARLVYKQP